MKLKKVVLPLCVIFFVLAVFINTALANGSMMWPTAGEISSDFGYRISPGGIGSSNHKGIDIAGDYGQPVVAADDGVVTYSGWLGGYGYYVKIDHGGGLMSGYGHNLENAVSVGDSVRKGQTIAYCGSTGNSTGPHLHFEIFLNGTAQPPYSYLGVPYSGSGGLTMDQDIVPVDYSVFYNFAAPMRNLIELVGAACSAGLLVLQDAMMWLFMILITMDLAWAFTWSMFNRDGAEGILEFLLKKLAVYGILMFCIQHWGVVLDMIRNYFVASAALMFHSDVNSAVAAMSDPTDVIQKGMQLTAPYFNYISSFTNPVSIMLNQAAIIVVFILGVLIVAIFLLLGIQIMLSYMEFYIAGLFSVISVTLGGFKHTREWPISQMGINGLIGSGLKLMWFTFFALMLSVLLQNMSVGGTFIETKNTANLDTFMQAIGDIESNGDYNTPPNEYGAKGKYQILEENWPSWCVEAGLPADTAWTPENQDRVARHKMQAYYEAYGNWQDVAIAWNAGGAWVGVAELPQETVNYLAKLEGKMNGVNTSFDLVTAVETFLAVLVMALTGNRIGGLIIRTFCAGGGFRWSPG
jgi:hypothetical protein